MRSSQFFSGLAFLVIGSTSGLNSASAQGPLTPPGAPAPTMRSLDEVESRTPVQSLPGDATAQYIISAPGAYYLTGAISGVSGKSAIAIAADSVTLDLAGHTITGTSGALRGVEFRLNRTGFAIRNGIIRNFDAGGISTVTLPATNGRIERLTLVSCSPGISFINGPPDGVVVSECTVAGGTGNGINLTTTRGLVERCSVSGLSGSAGVIGIVAQAVHSCAVTNLTSSGSQTVQGISCSEASQCAVNSVSNTATGQVIGISASVATGCDVQSILAAASSATGIIANSAENCSVSSVTVTSGSSSCVGLSVPNVHNSRASVIGSVVGAAGAPVGISASNASGCSVVAVGGTGSTSTPFGISAQNVQKCSVQTVGAAGSAVGATGVVATSVGHTFVSTVNGGSTGSATGINCSDAHHCEALNIALASGTGTSTGIQGDLITDSRVSTVTSGASGISAGLSGYREARSCIVSGVSNAGSGQAYGATAGSGGRTEAVVVQNGSYDVGILVGSGQTVIGCTVGASVTGISANGTRNVIDGNNLIGASTTGILVSSGFNSAQALIVRNQVRSATTNIVADAPCQVGPIVTATGTIASTNPWANFTD